jgi:hypothetical protein
MKDERTQAVIDLLSSLIMSHNGMLASEQYNPRQDADASDDYIAENKKFVTELRDIRQRFENLVTGVVE